MTDKPLRQKFWMAIVWTLLGIINLLNVDFDFLGMLDKVNIILWPAVITFVWWKYIKAKQQT